MTVNQLEALLNDIAAFNSEARELSAKGDSLTTGRETIIASAKALGINKANASKMLAKIRCEITVPGTGAETPAQAAE